MRGDTPVRIRTARARSKARDQLRELLRDTSLVQAVVVACNAEGAWTVLSGGMTGRDMGVALMVGTGALQRVLAQEAAAGGAGAPLKLDIRVPVEGGLGSTGRKRKPEITMDAEGQMVAPPGEAFMFCGECGASRWYVTINDATLSRGRQACIRCGNEVVEVQMLHQAGTA